MQTYIDNIQDLLLHNNLLKANPFDDRNRYYDIALLARARTLGALQVLDAESKGRLVEFLHDAQLIGYLSAPSSKTRTKFTPIIVLDGANLSGANFSGINLSGADFSSTNLSGANFSDTDLGNVDLYDANLSGAKINGLTDFTQEQLDQVLTCKNAILPKGLICHQNQ